MSRAGITNVHFFISVTHKTIRKNINIYSKEFSQIMKSSIITDYSNKFNYKYSIWSASGSSLMSQCINIKVGNNSIHRLDYLKKEYYFSNNALYNFSKDSFNKSDIILDAENNTNNILH